MYIYRPGVHIIISLLYVLLRSKFTGKFILGIWMDRAY